LLSLAVRGGRVVTGDGVREADILMLDGVIARLVAPGEGQARDEIDARGLVVLPGVVDAHVHVNEPGRTQWEGWLAATRGAARGGVTTIADMPLNSIPPTTDAGAFDAKYDAASRSAVVDFALWGGLVDDDARRLRALAECGVVGVKAFTCPSGVEEFPHLDAPLLPRALAAARDAGLLVALHCEDEEVLSTPHGTDARAWLDSRPIAAELAAIERVRPTAHGDVHVVHASCAATVTAARRAGLTVETCPHYLVFDADDVGAVGASLKCAPPIRQGQRDALWDAVLRGDVDYIASDHSPSALGLKQGSFTSAWGGVSGIQSTLAVLLAEGVHARGMTLAMLAQLLATRPAKRLGIWPRKGEVRAGSDADLVLVDLDREWTLTADALETRSGLSPYVGRTFKGAVTRTLVRGRTVYSDGKVVGTPGDGWFIQRVNA
jgi:allantoinase